MELIRARSGTRRRSSAWLNRAVLRGDLLRLRRGVYVDPLQWAAAPPWDRHRAEALATAVSHPEAVMCRETALALHGVPLLGTPQELHLRASSPSRAGLTAGNPLSAAGVLEVRGKGDVRNMRLHGLPSRRILPPVPRGSTAQAARERHRLQMLSPPETVSVRGISVDGMAGAVRVEPLAFAVVDTVPRLARPDAVVVLDAVVAGRARVSTLGLPFLQATAERWLWSRRAQAEWGWVSGFADPRSESPGESWSRVLIEELGFPPPQLQVPVRLPDGRVVRLDFAWPEHQVFGEFDGRMKYDDAVALSGTSDQSVYWQEKRREELIELVTGYRAVRWAWGDLRNPQRLAQRLRARGLPQR